jgi:hypothetical protein
LFETTLHPLPAAARESLAATAVEPELSALCWDPAPGVVRRLLENPRTGVAQARLIAAHHRDAAGLEALAAQAAFLRDAEVSRLLLRNVQTPVHLVERLLAGRPLHEVHNASQNRDLPERNRHAARGLLRRRFATGAPEERVDLILRTEGRALAALPGVALEARTVALLCGRSVGSVLLIENLARWTATPPLLLAHLLRQTIVRQAPSLQALIKRHPNYRPAG